MTKALRLLFVSLAAVTCLGRPLVRNVRTDSEFQKLLKHHKTVTGLPVIVDFFSHSCGPCRMIAPVFKRMAKQYKDKAVFAKINVNENHQTSGRLRIRSMPTFHFYLNGKLRHQFSGADQRRLEQFTRGLANEAERNNVRITAEALLDFFKKHNPEKTAEDVTKILEKAGGTEGGAGHAKLKRALKKKYGEAPVSEKRATPSSGKKKKGKGFNITEATTEMLLAELERRGEYTPFGAEDEEEEGAEGEEGNFAVWGGPDEDFPERLVIIGGGPAGLSAAIYGARAGLKPLVVAPPLGGQLQGKGVSVENYPGILGDTGPGIVAQMTLQAIESGAMFLEEAVISVDLSTRPFTVRTNSTAFRSHALIVATGANSRWLGVEGEHTFRGGGVSTCATCDGFLFRDMDVAVVGGGDTAMEDALVLARTSKSVTVIHRRDQFRASHVLAQRVLDHAKINVRWNCTVDAFEGEEGPAAEGTEGDADAAALGQDRLTHVLIRPNGGADAAVERLPVAGAFVAIGHDPNTGMFKGQLEMDDSTGYLTTQPPSSRTSIHGVFAAGDVADHIYRQAVTSAGTGAKAALDAERWLSEQGIRDERQALLDDLMAELAAEFGDTEEETEEYPEVTIRKEESQASPAATEIPSAEGSSPHGEL